ncbi:MAG: CBS domain-containing protein [Cytophagales bacterium]|nr:CBS domain-containing protein [Cytophagales bacterium]MDW8384609.1 CBS domain-containing protein [Flammeovirgaceae bacterium]
MNFTPKRASESTGKAVRKYEPVTEYMATNLITFHPDQSIKEAMDILLENKISGAPVLNDRRELVGILSEKDCLRVIIESSYHNQPMVLGKVSDYMSKNVRFVTDDKDVLDIANEFLNSNFRRFPVVDKRGRLVGQISRRDILRAAQKIASATL